MRRVLVIGPGGAGKSTLASHLGLQLNVEVFHLDKLYWQPGWVEMSKSKWRETLTELLSRDAWIMDGNYSGSLELRLQACDTVIFMDMNRALCLWRVLKRSIRYRSKRRPDM